MAINSPRDAKLLGIEGKRHPGARHYFDCGGVILPRGERRAGRAGAREGAQGAGSVQGARPAAGEVNERPWGERSFYAVDAWGNDLCFCEEGTLYT